MTTMRRNKTWAGDPINPLMGEGRFQDALRRMRQRISDGLPLKAVDSDTVGDKYIACSWGMCSEDPEQWPDKDDHTFPVDFVQRGRIAPRALKAGQHCPLNDRTKQKGLNGCFWSCHVFQTKERDRDVVLDLYDRAIRERVKKTAADDNEHWDQEV